MIDSFLSMHHAVRNAAITIANDSLYRQAVQDRFLQWKSRQPADIIQVLVKAKDNETTIQFLQEQYAAFRSPWWKFFLSYEPLPDIAKLNMPVLALNGGKDAQVDPQINLPAWEEGLKKSASPTYKTQEIAGLNHLFQHCVACGSVAEYMSLSETFDPATLQIISDWLKTAVR